ncbi:class I SAM-dependent methyltransferase [Nostoc piscinale]|uniref:class I SAM-dependent methyltransferase n=1 Tax=Nostoc piscinale TaxID=224012 RepID=UPI0009FAB5BF|nr:class I SAM-dependent methyltransferase [Nostoc piscinale]
MYGCPKQVIQILTTQMVQMKKKYIEDCITKASDISSHSAELTRAMCNWSSEYHFSPKRSNLLRPLKLNKSSSVLELGSGCGAITRYLAENVGRVVAVEGSMTRAKITSSRCRDLGNVETICSEFHKIEFDEKFDIVTLIGVLEYSGVYIKHSHPYQYALEIAKQFLKEDGVLIVAIENKLGLKYFAGCSEDHTSLPFDGIEGYSSGSMLKTFGKLELQSLLNTSGFAYTEFFYPFPDYKLPDVIMRIDNKDTNSLLLKKPLLYNWLNYNNNRDYNNNKIELFSEFLVAKQLEINGLLSQMSNSFLILASNHEKNLNQYFDAEKITWKYNVLRRKEFMTEVNLVKDIKNNSLLLQRQPIYPELSESSQHIYTNIKHTAQEVSSFIDGETLIEKIILAIRYSSTNNPNAFTTAIQIWYKFLVKEALRLLGSEDEIPGSYVDCTPWNLIITVDGDIHYIDREWNFFRKSST